MGSVAPPLASKKFMRRSLLWLYATTCAEPLLRELVRGLFQDGMIPPGSIVDAGANTGVETCLFASLDPERTVHAVDPLKHNIEAVKRMCANRLSNVQPLQGGIGAERMTLHVPVAKSLRSGQQISIASIVPGSSPLGTKRDTVAVSHVDSSISTGQRFEVWTLDELFETRWRGERLGFAHWDTEGNELDILRGGNVTLARDAPVFTVECVVHKSPAYTRTLLEWIGSMGYETFLIEEEAGLPLDTRNVLCLPWSPRSKHTTEAGAAPEAGTKHRRKHWRDSATIRRFLGSGRLVHVNASSVTEHAYPCCAQKGACCLSPRHCCMPGLVTQRLEGWISKREPTVQTRPQFPWTRSHITDLT